jgi:hypothetical protein
MLALEEACACQPSDGDKYFRRCPACEEWWRENSALVDELRLTPWEFPAYENSEADGDYEPNVAAIARYHALKAAADKAAKQKRKA